MLLEARECTKVGYPRILKIEEKNQHNMHIFEVVNL